MSFVLDLPSWLPQQLTASVVVTCLPENRKTMESQRSPLLVGLSLAFSAVLLYILLVRDADGPPPRASYLQQRTQRRISDILSRSREQHGYQTVLNTPLDPHTRANLQVGHVTKRLYNYTMVTRWHEQRTLITDDMYADSIIITDLHEQFNMVKHKGEPMYIEAITVCVNYGDYLKQSLERHKGLFDSWVIVTSEADLLTQSLCKEHAENNVRCVFSHRLYEDGAPFAKGRAINDGLAQMKRSDWIIQLDADTMLPLDFRKRLNESILRKDILYGLPRALDNGTEIWIHVGAGYFQMWHSYSVPIMEGDDDADMKKELYRRGLVHLVPTVDKLKNYYPELSPTAAEDDWTFKMRYNPTLDLRIVSRVRILFRDVIVRHHGKIFANHSGREAVESEGKQEGKQEEDALHRRS